MVVTKILTQLHLGDEKKELLLKIKSAISLVSNI